MIGVVDSARSSPREDEAAGNIRRLATDLLPRAGEIAAVITQQVLDAVPELAPTRAPEHVAVIRESTDQNVGAILATLAFGVQPGAIEPAVGTLTLLRQIVGFGGDITTLLHAYRVGHEGLWRFWADHVGDRVADAADLHLILKLSSAHIFTFIDSACENLVQQYRTHFGAPLTGRDSSPRDHVRALLGADAVDLDAATFALRYDLRAHHVGLVGVPLDAATDVRAALGALATVASATAFLAHPVGDGSWWAWLGWPQPPEEAVLADLTAATLTDVLVGLGEPGQGREGFRRSHAQGLEAERTARLSATPEPAVVRHRDIEVAALLCTDPERARRLAADRLDRLATRDDGTARLRETVRAYLAHGLSTARTAEALHVHQKTVTYRLTRATELLGRPVTKSTRELEAALLIDLTLNGS